MCVSEHSDSSERVCLPMKVAPWKLEKSLSKITTKNSTRTRTTKNNNNNNNLRLFDCKHTVQSDTTNIHHTEWDTQYQPRRAALYT